VLLVLAAIPPALLISVWAFYAVKPHVRQAEIASWTRAAAPRPLPRTLVIETSRSEDHLDYALRLAESGLFDVHILRRRPGRDNVTALSVEVGNWADCLARRLTKNDFAIRTGFTACGKFAQAASVPAEGLVLYADHFTAPLALKWPYGARTRVHWALQLALRDGAEETLIDYEESVAYPRVEIRPYGIWLFPSEPPYRKISTTSYVSDQTEADDFLFRVLEIDTTTIEPPSAQPPAVLAAALEPLAATGEREDVRRLLDAISAYPQASPELGALLRRITADPRVSSKLGQRITCPYLVGLAPYRASLIDGCAANADTLQGACGWLGSADDWFELCTDTETPIWAGGRRRGTRVLIGLPLGRVRSNITLGRHDLYPAKFMTVVIPSDRGMIDLVLTSESGTIWSLTGALECLGRLTAVGGHNAVLGLPRERVEHRYRFDARVASIDRVFRPNPPMAALLGADPDVSLIHVREPRIDLGETITRSLAKGSPACPAAETAGWTVSGPAESLHPELIDPHLLVTVPTVIPRRLP
jgi:hypothetical protein